MKPKHSANLFFAPQQDIFRLRLGQVRKLLQKLTTLSSGAPKSDYTKASQRDLQNSEL